ncbi:MAG: hypothetical protein C0401_06425, partial [Anaerolinea sp.]|nr:hypothetical protein [Anaerolinea sp.]
MKATKLFIIIVIAAGLILTACTSTPALTNTQWRLSTYGDQLALPNPDVTLNFTEDRISGSDGCNSYGGSYTTDGSNFKVDSDMVSTLMACDEQIMAQSSAF